MKRNQIKLLRELVRSVGNMNTVIRLRTKRLRDVKTIDLWDCEKELALLRARFYNLAQIWEEK